MGFRSLAILILYASSWALAEPGLQSQAPAGSNKPPAAGAADQKPSAKPSNPAQQKQAGKAPEPEPPAVLPPLETQKIETPPGAPIPITSTTGPGNQDPAKFKDLLHKIWLSSYRINDLLTEVHPERWKITEPTRQSFNQTLQGLRQSLASLDEWRGQFEKRTDSMYLGYQAYIAIDAILPRLEGVAKAMSQNENASLGAQFSQAQNQLFDLQGQLQPYLSALLKNQDQLLLAAQSDLAGCQNQLGFAMRPRVEPAVPMKNIMPELKGRRVRHSKAANSPKAAAEKGKAQTKKAEKTSETKSEAAKKPAAPPPAANLQTKK